MANDLGPSVRDALVDFLAPLQETARDPKALIDWFAALGQTQAISGDPALLEIARHAHVIIEKLSDFESETLKSWSGLTSILETGRQASEIQRELRRFAQDPGRAHVAEGLAEQVMSLLLATYLRRRHPTLFRIASLLKLIEARENLPLEPPLIENGATIRYPWILDRFKFASAKGLISRPGETLAEAYFPNNMAAAGDAWSAAARLYLHLLFLADELGLPWSMAYRPVVAAPPPLPSDEPEDALLSRFDPGNGEEEPPLPAPPPPDEYFGAHFPIFRLTLARSESGPDTEAAMEFLASSARHPGTTPGYIFRAVGSFNTAVSSDQWRLMLSATGQIPAFVLTRTGFDLAPDGLPVSGGAAKILLERLAPEGSSGPDFLFGSAEGSRLELGSVSFEAGLLYDPARKAVSLSANASKCSFVIAPSDGDGFLSEVLPSEGVKAGFDLGLAWSSDRGLNFGGAAGLETDLPVGLSIGGAVTVPTIHLSLKSSDAGLLAEVSASIGVSIGPVNAAIDRVGFTGALTYPEDGGNFGAVDLDLGFKPPNGVGLSIDEAVVTGGGFLAFDSERGQYAGIVELNLEGGIAVKGMGLIATRLPNNVKGFSLLIVIQAEDFKPIPLPLGFRLIGIGGLLAINRTFDEVALRAGLKNHALDSVLFPKDPIRNAPQILSNLNSVFPPAKDHHLFGPMAQITWGTPPLLTADLGLVLEFGARLRLLILAQVLAILPRPKNELIRLQMDAIGVVDFDQGTAALDATLYDSRLLKKFVLTGDMAMRLKWEGSPNFALAVGGLHPAFNPPANFPKLERIALNLSAGDNPRIRCEAYFALTANTVQFGARAELYAAASGFSIQGEIGFDVLIQRDPFHFLADYYAQLQLKRKSTNLFKVRVEGALEGPRPLHIKGKATFEILWWDVSVRFDKTLVEGEKPPRPEPIDVLALLREALGNPGNWMSQLPAGQRPMVTLRENPGAAGDVLLHPLGTLTVKQGVVPLDMDISLFGPAVPAGARRFTISGVSLGGQTSTTAPVRDFFAPAQFFEMSDDEKLSRPSFEAMAAGVSIGSDQFDFSTGDCLKVDAIKFETWIVEKGEKEPRPSHPEAPSDLYTLSPELLGQQARFGAAANSDLRRSGRAKYRTAMVGKYQVQKEGWSIVATDDLTVQPVPGIEASKPAAYSEAAQALQKLKQEDPRKAAGVKILRLSEVRASIE